MKQIIFPIKMGNYYIVIIVHCVIITNYALRKHLTIYLITAIAVNGHQFGPATKKLSNIKLNGVCVCVCV